MKKIYWRPSKVSQSVLFLVAAFSVVCLLLVEKIQTEVREPHYQEALEAASLAQKAFQTVKTVARKRGIQIDIESDPLQTGLIGRLVSPITSNTGHLEAKQTSINPNFAAVMVRLFKKADLQEGDFVAVGVSGSFPAINIAVYSAIKTLKLKPIIIASAGASQWGANDPQFSWLEMEKILYEKNLFNFRSEAASLGGIEDRGLGMSKKGKDILKKVIEENEMVFINTKDVISNIEERLAFYDSRAGTNKVKAYINIGGGTISVGRKEGKMTYHPGLNKTLPREAAHIDSIMTRFSRRDVPVIHLVKIIKLAESYGLPVAPLELPKVGEGSIYYRVTYNRYLVVAALVAILLSLYAFIRSDLGYRIFQSSRKKSSAEKPKQMV